MEKLSLHDCGLFSSRVYSLLDRNIERYWLLFHEQTLSVCIMSWDCGLRYVFIPPVLQLGGVCALRDGGGTGGVGMGTMCGREDLTSRLGLEAVQRLAKDGCRLLQNHNYRIPDRNQTVSWVSDDGTAKFPNVSDISQCWYVGLWTPPCNLLSELWVRVESHGRHRVVNAVIIVVTKLHTNFRLDSAMV